MSDARLSTMAKSGLSKADVLLRSIIEVEYLKLLSYYSYWSLAYCPELEI
jgi:hypothetical protein